VKVLLLKKTFFILLLAACIMALAAGGWTFASIHDLPDVSFLADPLVSFNINVRDWNGDTAILTVGPDNPYWIPFKAIPSHLQNAVLSGEDFSFYSHKGVDWFELRESLIKDFREGRFARGASTITQQLAKNLFLSRDKTIKRKVRELALARRMENTLTKDRILELYLNVVELGDMVYGVGEGARYHFGKQPFELSLRESTFLAAMLPGPKVYDPDRNRDLVMNRSDHLLGVMLKGQMITEDQYLAALVEIPFYGESSYPVEPDQYPVSIADSPTETEKEQVSTEEHSIDSREFGTPDEEVFLTTEGIVEIPIEKPKVNGER
jgi:monofunctional biosynthetic peptidoglycan transglycosylase